MRQIVVAVLATRAEGLEIADRVLIKEPQFIDGQGRRDGTLLSHHPAILQQQLHKHIMQGPHAATQSSVLIMMAREGGNSLGKPQAPRSKEHQRQFCSHSCLQPTHNPQHTCYVFFTRPMLAAARVVEFACQFYSTRCSR